MVETRNRELTPPARLWFRDSCPRMDANSRQETASEITIRLLTESDGFKAIVRRWKRNDVTRHGDNVSQ